MPAGHPKLRTRSTRRYAVPSLRLWRTDSLVTTSNGYNSSYSTAPSRESWKTWWNPGVLTRDAARRRSAADVGVKRLCLRARDSVCELDERVRGGDLVSILVPRDSDDSPAHPGDLQHTDPVPVRVHREPWQDSGADTFCGEAQNRAIIVGSEDDLVAQGRVAE